MSHSLHGCFFSRLPCLCFLWTARVLLFLNVISQSGHFLRGPVICVSFICCLKPLDAWNVLPHRSHLYSPSWLPYVFLLCTSRDFLFLSEFSQSWYFLRGSVACMFPVCCFRFLENWNALLHWLCWSFSFPAQATPISDTLATLMLKSLIVLFLALLQPTWASFDVCCVWRPCVSGIFISLNTTPAAAMRSARPDDSVVVPDVGTLNNPGSM